MNVLIEVNPLLHTERTGIPSYVHWLCHGLLQGSGTQRVPGVQGSATQPPNHPTTQSPDHWTLWAPDLERDPLPELPNKRFRGRRLLPRAVLERAWRQGARIESVPAATDLYHLPFPAFPAPRRSPRTKLVVTVFDLAFARYPETLVDREYLRYLSRCFPAQVEQADHILAISECTKRDLVEILDVPEERIDVTYLGTDLQAPAPGEAPPAALAELALPPRYIFCVGTLEPRKNLPGVLHAAHRLKTKLEEQDVYLCLAGGARWRYQEMDRLIEELGLEERVRRLGYVPRECLPHLYQRAALFVYPSFYEGFGLPVLEAMACGAPVITSRGSSLGEVAGDAALLIDPHAPAELAAAIERLLDDEPLRADLIRRGAARAARFSWQQTARQTLDVFRKVAPRS